MKICSFVVKNNELIEFDSKKVQKATIATGALTSNTLPVLAAETVNVAEAFDPIIQVITDLADPLAYACFVKGGLLFMIGNEHEGKKTINNTLKGYIIVKFVPQILELLGKIVLS